MNNRLKEIRKLLNLNQCEFGEKLGVQKSAISKIERGENNISPSIEKLIYKEFNINPTWFQTGEGEMFLKPSNEDEELAAWIGNILTSDNNDFKKKMAYTLSKLNPEQWQALEQIAKMLLEQQENNK